MRTAAFAVALAVTLAACQPQPAPADLTPLANAITNLNDTVTALSAHLDAMSDRVLRLDDNVRKDLAALNQAAVELHALVQQPISFAGVDLASIDLLAITTFENSINFLILEPGACPEDARAGLARVPANETLASVLMPAPTGPHCLSLVETETRKAASVTIMPVNGGVLTVNLFPDLK